MSASFSQEITEYLETDTSALRTAHNVCVYCISVVGILGNMVSFAVLSRPEFKSPVNCCLQFLAVSDTLVLCFYLVMAEALDLPYWILVIMFTVLQVSVWTTMLVSFERFIALCFPLKATYICSYRKTLFYNIMTIMLSFCLNIPRMFLFENYEAHRNYHLYFFLNSRYRADSDLLKAHGYHLNERDIYRAECYSWMELAWVYLVPMIVIAFFNIKMYIAARATKKRYQQLSSSQQQDIYTSKMIFAVVMVFFTTGAPWVVFKIITHYGTVTFLTYVKLLYLLNPLIVSNSAANFIIYFALNRDFRSALLEALKNAFNTFRAFFGGSVARNHNVPNVDVIEDRAV